MNTSTEEIDLEDLILRDKVNRRYVIGDVQLSAGDVAKIRINRGTFQLSNNNGEIQLLKPSGEVIDQVEYSREDLPAKGNTIVF